MSVKSIAYNIVDALSPAASVFVSANAGAGKTSLLTNRVLSLLLHGAQPSKILCLTFTNAAAAEMVSRVQKELGKWVMADDENLSDALAALLGKIPEKHTMAHARSLFAKVLESPERIRIQTIHGFCQSLLRRFPIEAGISPHFTVMDSRTEQELLQEARLRLFNRAQAEDARLQEALQAIAHRVGEAAFKSLVTEIIQHKRRIRSLFAESHGVEAAIEAVYRVLDVPMGSTRGHIFSAYLPYDDDTLSTLRTIAAKLLTSDKKTDQKTGQGMASWLENFAAGTLADYVSVFVTDTGGKRQKLFTKDALTDPALIEALEQEQDRVWRFSDALKALEIAESTAHVLHFSEALLALYTSLKHYHALMDYDDLILTACGLLLKPDISPWVLFKLDGGIDHILVDEAQDTSPEQWTIISSLTQEFFAGSGRTENDRSLFIVGDEKQSIYSFQGADPVALGKMQNYFAEHIQAADKPLHRIGLHYSFRSTSEVLAVVDAVFSKPSAREGLTFGNETLTHIPTRVGYPGLVELWPLTEPEEGDGVTVSSFTLLARRIAGTIRTWIDDGVMLEAKGRPVGAGDIMILVRSRTVLVDRLVRALKKHNIPVAGHDRMMLSDNLAVQDLMVLGQCILLPEDDLSLAALLKSPIFDISEDQLFTLAHGRVKQSLWERLREYSAQPPFQSAFALLSDVRARADFISPFALYSYVLDTLGARRRFTGRMGEEYNDPMDEFLGQALLYERSHTSSLQGFLHWLNASDSEIKRDMEQAKDCVRIMTVHGAKGLQAPIVILPDTIEIPRQRNTLQWYNADIPLWSTSDNGSHSLCMELRAYDKSVMLAEYRRLLYVALTRAEDRLYVCGATAKETINEQCWYQLVKDGMAGMATTFETAWGEGLRVGVFPNSSPIRGEARRGACWNSAVSIRPHPGPLPNGEGEEFDFLHRAAPPEPVIAQPLVPSRLAIDEPAAASPLTSTKIYQRGTLIHRLLQHLPDIDPDNRNEVVVAIASGFKKSMAESDINACISEALAVMEDPQFTFLFGGESLAEVPVAGCVDVAGKNVAVSGQIDRLCIRGDEVWIVDFKSNRAVPANIPTAYLQQMRLYSLLLQQIYPDKIVRCALVWTSVPKVTVIAESLLDETPISTYI